MRVCLHEWASTEFQGLVLQRLFKRPIALLTAEEAPGNAFRR